jgi:hypothetical protein
MQGQRRSLSGGHEILKLNGMRRNRFERRPRKKLG